MTILAYFALFLLPAGWAAVRRRLPGREGAAAALVGLALCLFIGLRREVGGDWNSYLLIHERAASHPLWEALLLGDPAYMALGAAAAAAGLGVGAVNLVCASLFSGGLLLWCRRQSSPPLALLIALPVAVLVVSLNATRQSAALGLEMLALVALLDRRRGAAAALLLAACAFHRSAALLLPLAVLPFLPNQWRNGATAALWALALLAALPFATGAEEEPNRLGALARLSPSLASVALLFWLRERLGLAAGEREIAFYLAGLTLFCAALLPLAPMPADRLAYYSIPLQMLILPRAAESAPAVPARAAAKAGLLIFFPALFALWLLLSPYRACMVPYRSYLETPSRLLRAAEPEAPRLMCVQVVPAAERRLKD